eukprot:XP_011608368.1 PREDICTED: E3 ubiquitin-protein ligase MARCH7 isoform X1 [Takifugu rubripes]
MMDSGSRRLPFFLPSSRPSYISSPRLSSSSLGSTRLHSGETASSHDRFPRVSSSYKADLDQQSSRLLGSRDFGSSESRSSSWKLPSSLTSSSRSYDRPWADSTLGSRIKSTDSEGTLGMRSVVLNAADDGDSKRAKMSYSNRGLYSRTPSTLATGSTFTSKGLSSARDVGEKQRDTPSPTPCRFHARSSTSSSSSSSSSNPLWSRRETKNESGLAGLGEGRIRSGFAPSLCQSHRVTSTYAQGARPKETTYCSPSSSSSYSPMARESSRNHLTTSSTSQYSSLGRDLSSRTSARFSLGSPRLQPPQEQQRSYQTSPLVSPSFPSRTSLYAAPSARAETALPPRPNPEGVESEGTRSTRRLLSRLFSRRSSQDSSSGSSIRSLDDDGPSAGGKRAVTDQGTRTSCVEPSTRTSETTFGILRNRRTARAPVQESNPGGYRGGPSELPPSSREPGAGSSVPRHGGMSSSWLSSSIRDRCSPLLSRLRRHARDESQRSSGGWSNNDCSSSHDDDHDEEEEEEEEKDEGAAGLPAFGNGGSRRLPDGVRPASEDDTDEFSPRRRVGVCENVSLPRSFSSVENQTGDQKEADASGKDEEKLRKIKERLLLEESDEEEGDMCRICQMGEDSSSNPLIQPCRCIGSLQYVHQDCIKRWICSKISSATNLEAITTCELCKEKLHLNIDDFNIQELYRTHVQSEYDEFISSGLYLVVLLHFCEQRFSDVLGAVDGAGLFNVLRILHEHMDNLENPLAEDEEVQDNRPSIEFSDLDDDLEDEY